MEHIFISYSSKDHNFASQLADTLNRFYKVWIDQQKIPGGYQWEQAIDNALKECHVFVVIVSPDSNQSDWVTRETIRAEQLGKYRIPALLEGELPLRLLDLHYIDFRAGFEGALLDLLEVLKRHIAPEQAHTDEVHRILGAGVSEFLQGNYPAAHTLIGQALALKPEVADSLEEFWKKMRETPKTGLADNLRDKISIHEEHTSVPLPQDNPKYGKYFDWSIEINAQKEVITLIDFVQYELHHSFNQPIQVVRNRADNFRLVRRGWAFRIPVTVRFIDGTEIKLKHDLSFGIT